jgi:hypothetical protein
MASFVIAAGIVACIAAYAYGHRAAEDGGDGAESALTREVGPRSYWPWLSPGLGLLSLIIALLSVGAAGGRTHTDGDCLDVCLVPSAADLASGLRGVGLAAAAVAGIVGALALRDASARIVAVTGLVLAGAAGLLTLATV